MKVCAILTAFDPPEGFVEGITKRLSELHIQHVIVVNNGTSKLTLKSYDNTVVQVINVGRNLGSAGGFKTGILEACRTDNDYFWLLDHDNLPELSSLIRLKENWRLHNKGNSNEKLMLLSYRPALMKHIYPFKSNGLIHIGLMKDSYLGFHIKKLWKIFKNRVTTELPKNDFITNKAAVAFGSGYYGGLFFSKNCISENMLPNESFFTFWDDIDFTMRFRKRGGNILLIPSSIINDLDDHSKSKYSESLFYHPGLELKPRFKSFYYIRNIRILELRRGIENPLIHAVNKMTILSVLYILALLRGTSSQFKLLLKSMKSAEKRLKKNE